MKVPCPSNFPNLYYPSYLPLSTFSIPIHLCHLSGLNNDLLLSPLHGDVANTEEENINAKKIYRKKYRGSFFI